MQTQPTPGVIVLFGSGETSPSGQKVFNQIFQKLPFSPKVDLIETPAGFELNSEQVIGRVGAFLEEHLQNFKPEINYIPARKRGTEYSPDEPTIVSPLLEADLIFMGPGSPTYAIRQLSNSLAWYYMIARHRLGASLVLASAATIAVGAYSLPIYEIYKVGEDLHWKTGLDLFAMYGMPLVFVPHWNNNDGGNELDTSRCYMGKERFSKLMHILPVDLTLIGLDEHTALMIDPCKEQCSVFGIGKVTLLHSNHTSRQDPGSVEILDPGLATIAQYRGAHVHQYSGGETFALKDWFPFKVPELGVDLPEEVWDLALTVAQYPRDHSLKSELPPEEIIHLAELRLKARRESNWITADSLRDQIALKGWKVSDTNEGYILEQL